MRFRHGLVAALIGAMVPMAAWANTFRLGMNDVGLGFLDARLGHNLIAKPLAIAERLPKAQPSVSRLRGDLGSFFNEYDVLRETPVLYEQVGDREFDQFFFSSAKTSGTVKTSRLLVDKVARNLVGLAKSTAAAGELGNAEQMLKDEPDDAANAALAVLKKQKDKLGDEQRDSLLKMLVAMSGTGIALKEATAAVPALTKDGENLTKVATPDGLRNRFGMNFGMLARIPGILDGTGKSMGALAQVTTDAPALAKNVAVITAGLVSLFE